MKEPALIASEIFDVFSLEKAIEASTERSRALLWYLESQIHKRRLIRFVFVMAKLAFDLRLHLAFKRKPVLVLDVIQLRIKHGRDAISGFIVHSNLDLRRALSVAVNLLAWLLGARTRRRLH